MKRSAIIPNQKHIPVSGTKNMREIKNLLGSKAMLLENNIRLDSRDIIYFQKLDGEQVSLTQEINNPPTVYSLSKDKQNNHSLFFDDSKWVLEIDIYKILINYLFASIKKARSFNGILNSSTLNNSVRLAILDYIDKNIIDLYSFSEFELFVEYYSLDNPNRFLRNNIFSSDVNTKQQNFTLDLSNVLRVEFTQLKDIEKFNFNYYFNINFSR